MAANKFQNKYRIPSARAMWHDNNGGEYFVTICTAQRRHYFGEITNGDMHQTMLAQQLDKLILEIKTHHPYAEIPVYQIMPNHVHLIVCIDGGDDCRDVACRVSKGITGITAETGLTGLTGKNEQMRDIANHRGLLSTTIGGLKSALTKYANANYLEFRWQTRFHDHIIRNQDEMNRIATYIENNIETWVMDKFNII